MFPTNFMIVCVAVDLFIAAWIVVRTFLYLFVDVVVSTGYNLGFQRCCFAWTLMQGLHGCMDLPSKRVTVRWSAAE